MHPVMTTIAWFVGVVYGIGAGIKTLVWWKSLGWALRHGSTYAEQVLQTPAGELDRQRRLQLIAAHGGAFKPCGAKSVRLLQAPQTRVTRARSILFVATPVFILEGGIAAICLSFARDVSMTASVVAVCIAAWVCLYSLMLLSEAIVWYVIAKDYTRVWGDVKFALTVRGPEARTLGDFKALGAVTLTAALACSILVSVVSQAFGGYSHLPRSEASTLGIPTLVSSLYYVLSNLTTVGDSGIGPTTSLARLSSGLVQVAVLLTAGFIISTLSARMSASA